MPDEVRSVDGLLTRKRYRETVKLTVAQAMTAIAGTSQWQRYYDIAAVTAGFESMSSANFAAQSDGPS